MKAYSTDLREKIALLYDTNDYSLDEVADLFDVGRRTVARFVQKHRAGLSLAPQPHAGGYPTVLTPEIHLGLRDKVTQTPDATLLELTSYLKTKAHVSVHLSTVCRALQRLGLPRKKTLALTRPCGRAPRGERVLGHVPCDRGANHSLIGSLGLRGVIASLLLRGSVDYLAFDAFVNELLLPRLSVGDVLLLDNLPAHKASRVETSAARAKAQVIWLPAWDSSLLIFGRHGGGLSAGCLAPTHQPLLHLT